nr:tetratricopeptide repeat protein [uncultured Albidiferax sp.]
MDGTSAPCSFGDVACAALAAWDWIGSGPLANYIQVFGGMAGGAIAVHRWMSRHRKKDLDDLKQAGELIRSLTKKNAELKDALAEARTCDPNVWATQGKKEIQDGNPRLATRAVRNGFDGSRDALFSGAMLMASAWQRGDASDVDTEVEEAAEWARLAMALRPVDRDAQELAAQIRVVQILQLIGNGDLAQEPRSIPGGWVSAASKHVSEGTVAALLASATASRDRGQNVLYERLAATAEWIAMRELGDGSRGTLSAMWTHAEAIMLCGRIDEALAAVQAAELTLAASTETDLCTQLAILKAVVLVRMGHDAEALAVLEAVEASADPEYRNHVRYRKAEVLKWMERFDEAQATLESIDTAWVRTSRELENAVQHLRADILNRQGRHENAISTLEPVVKHRAAQLGSKHPQTLESRFLQAQILGEMGRAEAARALASPLVSDMTEVHGPSHPNTLGTQQLLARSLIHQQRFSEAFLFIRPLVDRYIVVLGATHRDTMEARSSLAQILGGLGQFEEANKLQAEVVDWQIAVRGKHHPLTLLQRSILATFTYRLGDLSAAHAMASELLLLVDAAFGTQSEQAENLRGLLSKTGG